MGTELVDAILRDAGLDPKEVGDRMERLAKLALELAQCKAERDALHAQVAELTEQRDALLEACKMGGEALIASAIIWIEMFVRKSNERQDLIDSLRCKLNAEHRAIKLVRGGDDARNDRYA